MKRNFITLLGMFVLCSCLVTMTAWSQCTSTPSINEILFDPTGTETAGEYVEIAATAGTDLSCYMISDGDWVIVIPSGTVVPADGVLGIGCASTVESGGAAPDLDLETCGCFSSGSCGPGFTNTGEFVAIFDATGSLVDGIIFLEDENGSSNGPNGQSEPVTFPLGCADIGNLTIPTVADYDMPPAPWTFVNINPAEGNSLAADGDCSDTWVESTDTQAGGNSFGASNGTSASACSVLVTNVAIGPCNGDNYSITFNIEVTGGSGEWSAVDASDNSVYSGPSVGISGAVGPFSADCTEGLPAINIIDTNDPTCVAPLIYPAMTCPCACIVQIEQAAAIRTCDEGDPDDPDDDTFTVCVTASVFNGSGSFIITDGVTAWPMTGMGVANMMEGCAGPFPADGMTSTGILFVRDANEEDCDVSVGPFGPIESCGCNDYNLTAVPTCTDANGDFAAQDNYFVKVEVGNTFLTFPIPVTIGGTAYSLTSAADVIYHPVAHTGNRMGGGAFTTVVVGDEDCQETVNVPEILCGYLVDGDGNSDGTQDNVLNGSGPWCDCNGTMDGGYILAQGDPSEIADPALFTQLYVLVNATGIIIGSNNTGLFAGLFDGTYDVYAYNYNTTDDATVTGAITDGTTTLAELTGIVDGLGCSATCMTQYTLSCDCGACPQIGFAQAPAIVCSDVPFDLEISGLVDFALADNADMNFDIDVYAFHGAVPTDPYDLTNASSVGTVEYMDLDGSGQQFASFPMIGNMLGVGTYTLCATLSPLPVDMECRPSACTTIEVVSAPVVPEIDDPVIMVCEEGDQTISLMTTQGDLPFDASWLFDGDVTTGTASDNSLVTVNNATFSGNASFQTGASGDAISGSGWTEATLVDAIAMGNSYEFCVTAPTTQDIIVTDIEFFTRSSGTGPSDYAVYCGTTQVGVGTTAIAWATAPDAYTTSATVPGGTQKCFQIYAWGASSGAGTLRLDEVKVSGTSTSTAPFVYNFYDGDPTMGGSLLASGVSTYDPMLTLANSPTTIYVATVNQGCESDAIPVILDLEGDRALACNDNVNVSVGENCEAEITPDLVIEGSSVLNAEIIIKDADGNIVPNTLSGEYIGQTFTYEFFSTCTRNSCWGNITIELKNIPFIEGSGNCLYNATMTPDEISCELTCGADPWHLVTSEEEILAELESCNLSELRYVDHADGSLCSGDGIFHTVTWEILVLIHDEYEWVPILTEAYWERPIPVSSVGCPSDAEEFLGLPLDGETLGDEIDEFLNGLETGTGSGTGYVINNWIQTGGELEWNCAWGSYEPDDIAAFFDDESTTAEGTKYPHMIEGVIFAYPWVAQDINNNGEYDSWGEFIPIIPGETEVCNLLSSYTDSDFPSCGGAKSVLRTWTILDECSGSLYICEQRINIVDDAGPKFNKHESPLPLVYSTTANTCMSSFAVPPLEFEVKDVCSDFEITVMIETGGKPLILDIGDVVELAEGLYPFTYVATDACGNVTLLEKTLRIVDNNPPVAVCNDALSIVLTPQNFDGGGFGAINAEDIDAGSHDNGCGEVYFKVIRKEDLRNTSHGYWNNLGPGGTADYGSAPKGPFFPPYACDGLNGDDFGNIVEIDEKGINVEITFEQVFFDDEIFFCCDDLDDEIEVVLRVFDRDPGSGPVDPYRMDGNVSTGAFSGTTEILEDENGDPVLDAFGNVVTIFNSIENDLANHYTECVVKIKIEDAIGLTLTCPDDLNISCLDVVDPFDNQVLGVASANGLCGEICVEYQDINNFEDAACSEGVIIRTWFVDQDCSGDLDDEELISTQCQQLIQVGGDGAFDPATIKWPPHYTGESVSGIRRECNFSYDENEQPGAVSGSALDNVPVFESHNRVSMPSPFECIPGAICEPEWDEPGCGIIGKTATIDTVYFEEDACVKILKHWRVIDWCIWEPNTTQDDDDIDDSNGDLSDLGNFDATVDHGPFYGFDMVEAVEDWTPGQCSKPSCSSVYYRYVRPNAEDTDNDSTIDMQLYYDPLTGETNYNYVGNPVAVVDNDGLYNYTQVIKVINKSEPIIQFCQDIDVAAVDGCQGELFITNTGMDVDDCPSQWLKWDVELFDAAWELIDYYEVIAGNGEKIEINVAEEDGLDSDLEAEGLLNRGTYRVRWTLSDGCGNSTSCVQFYTVKDVLPPSPVCIQDLTTALMDEAGNVTIWASDYNIRSIDNCTDEEDLLYSFSGEEYQPSLTLSCDDFVKDGIWESFEVFMWVWDDSGNRDFCEVWLRVDDNFDVCDDIGNAALANIGGDITTELGDAIDKVDVEIMATLPEFPASMFTENDGKYAFADIPMSSTYTITPTRNDNYLNGVSTIDLVLIQKHILGLDMLDSAYKVIAADINNDGRVSAIDLVELRKLILGIYDVLPANTSWKFVDADQPLDQLTPWNYSEEIVIQDLASDRMSEDFIGIKIGDVSGNASPNDFANTEIRSNGTLMFAAQDMTVAAGEEITLVVRADNFDDVYGYQFTMHHKGLTLIDVEEGDLNVNNDNLAKRTDHFTMSWHVEEGVTSVGDLFRLTFVADSDLTLSEVIRLDSDATPVEAYTGKDLVQKSVDIIFKDGNLPIVDVNTFDLYQNEPNPFVKETVVGFVLPSSGEAIISIMDVNGKLIREYSDTYARGYNEILIHRKDINLNGVFIYQLEFDNQVISKKMLLMN